MMRDAEAHLLHHFQSIQDIVETTTLPSLLPTLSAALAQASGVQGLLARLRTGPPGNKRYSSEEKAALWEELKVASLAQLLLTVRLLPLLALTVRCQLSILGRYLYLESALEADGPGPGPEGTLAALHTAPRLSTPSQERFLSFADHLAREGHAPPPPGRRARRAAAAARAKSLQDAVSERDVAQLLSDALSLMDSEPGLPTYEELALPSKAAVALALAVPAPDDRALVANSESMLVDGETVTGMLGELRRTLESGSFARCAQACERAAAVHERRPLAKVIPLLVAASDEAYSCGPSGLAAELAAAPLVKGLAATVYACGPPQIEA
ncbi:hypothetical protein QBZ16_000102 [Prototheca wickerhamii]|uniref:Uncharacterized protein n=1 Tax=Prototheca wickerhamii TaxID=3111 RepID=A0AAD9MII9_PROWI|nr:hypothetical protein QBZ16_000102 [Prototheca wickerhamii]